MTPQDAIARLFCGENYTASLTSLQLLHLQPRANSIHSSLHVLLKITSSVFFQLKIKTIWWNCCRGKKLSCTQGSQMSFAGVRCARASLTAFHSLRMYLLITTDNCDASITSVVAIWTESTSPFMD